MKDERLIFRVHALRRLSERQIGVDDVRQVLATGEVVEDYPDDTPYPSRLLLGWQEARPIHVVAAYNRADKEVIVITAYEPESSHWNSGFKRRKS